MPKTNNDVKQRGSSTSSATIDYIHSANTRGELLAARIEEGAAGGRD